MSAKKKPARSAPLSSRKPAPKAPQKARLRWKTDQQDAPPPPMMPVAQSAQQSYPGMFGDMAYPKAAALPHDPARGILAQSGFMYGDVANAGAPTQVTPTADTMLREAADMVGGDRQETHGQKERSFNAIAAVWNAYLSVRKSPHAPISGTDVAWMMSWLKTVRSLQGKVVADHAVDAAGYAAIAGEIGLVSRA